MLDGITPAQHLGHERSPFPAGDVRVEGKVSPFRVVAGFVQQLLSAAVEFTHEAGQLLAVLTAQIAAFLECDNDIYRDRAGQLLRHEAGIVISGEFGLAIDLCQCIGHRHLKQAQAVIGTDRSKVAIRFSVKQEHRVDFPALECNERV